eukprot:COSAG02_NODE_3291_length_6997_cov_7.096260_1_plen_722_part_00
MQAALPCGLEFSTASADGAYTFGEKVEIFSKSANSWCEGRVQQADIVAGIVTVEYRQASGREMRKMLTNESVDLRKVKRPTQLNEEAQQATAADDTAHAAIEEELVGLATATGIAEVAKTALARIEKWGNRRVCFEPYGKTKFQLIVLPRELVEALDDDMVTLELLQLLLLLYTSDTAKGEDDVDGDGTPTKLDTDSDAGILDASFKQRIEKCHRDLDQANAIMHAKWLEVQKKWVELKRTYDASVAFRSQLQQEGLYFDATTDKWNELMRTVATTPNLIELVQEKNTGCLDILETELKECEVILDSWHEKQPLRDDREFVLEMVKTSGAALEYASETLRADHEIVLAAATQWGPAFKFASPTLKADSELVKKVVAIYPPAIQYASAGLRARHDVVLAAVHGPRPHLIRDAFGHTPAAIREDRTLILAAAARSGNVLCYASLDLRGDREVVLTAVGSSDWHGYTLEFVSTELRDDREVVLAAVRNDRSSYRHHRALPWASATLQADPEVRLAAGCSSSTDSDSDSDSDLHSDLHSDLDGLGLFGRFETSSIRSRKARSSDPAYFEPGLGKRSVGKRSMPTPGTGSLVQATGFAKEATLAYHMGNWVNAKRLYSAAVKIFVRQKKRSDTGNLVRTFEDGVSRGEKPNSSQKYLIEAVLAACVEARDCATLRADSPQAREQIAPIQNDAARCVTQEPRQVGAKDQKINSQVSFSQELAQHQAD